MTQYQPSLSRQNKAHRSTALATLGALTLFISLLSACSLSRPNADQTSWWWHLNGPVHRTNHRSHFN